MMQDLAEHMGLLLTIIGTLVSVVGMLVWKKLNAIEWQVSKSIEQHHVCREALPKEYARAETVDKIFDKLDIILQKLNEIPLVYRTKNEAHSDWQTMNTLIREIQESLRKIEIRLKLNNVEK